MACNSPLSGNGSPGANLADACVCNAAIGSVYVDTATLDIYVKTASGCTAGAWSTLSGCNCNFTLTDANANTQTLANGDTLTVLGTNGIVATVSATDTITINGLSTFGSGAPVANPANTSQVNTYVDCTNKQFYVWCPSSLTWESVYSFKISDGTTNQTLNAADTLTVTGQNGVKATVSATDTLTIDGLTKVGAGAPVANPTDTSVLNSYFDTTNNILYEWNPVSLSWQTAGLIKITDGTTTENLNLGNTLTVTGQNGIKATVSATDTLTIDGLTSRGLVAPVAAPADANQVGFYLDTVANALYKWNPATANWSLVGGSFTITDGTNSQVINGGDTETYVGTNGITVTVSATDTVTINGLTTFGVGAPIAVPATPTQINSYYDTTNKVLYVWNPTALTWETSGLIKITDGTTTENLNLGNILTVTGTGGIKAIVSATDTLTINGLTTFGAAAPVANPADTAQVAFYLDTTAGALYKWNPTTLAWSTTSAASSFNLTDGTTTQVINSSDTMTVTGINGVSAVVSATDTLTISGLTTFSAVAPVAAPTTTNQVNFHLDTATGTLYKWNPTTLTWSIAGAISMNDLTDADTVTNPPVTNQPLMWNGVSNWTPIDATCPAANQATTFLGYDGTNYGYFKPRQVLGYRSIAANGTLIPATDGVVSIDASGGTRTFTLVAPAACDPKDFWVKRLDSTVANSVTISGGTIDGVASITLGTPGPFSASMGEAVHLMNIGGNNWIVI